MKLPQYQKTRLKEINRQLYPATLRFRGDRGLFLFSYYRNKRDYRKSLGKDIEIAYERALILRKEFDSMPVVANKQITLNQLHEAWKAKRWAELSPKTREGYATAWGHVSDDLGFYRLDKITADYVEAELAKLNTKSIGDHTGVFLSVLFGWAVKHDLLIKKPFSRSYKKQKKKVHILSPEKIKLLIESVSESCQIVLALAAWCGLRRGEIFGLRMRDIDLDQNLLTIENNRIWASGQGGVSDKSTKTGDPRVLPLMPQVLHHLLPVMAGKSPDDYLFVSIRFDISERLKTACKRVGLPRLRLHELRHIAITNAMLSGGVAIAQALAGHQDIRTTVDTYGHMQPAHLARHMNAGAVGAAGKAGIGIDVLEYCELRELAEILSDNNSPEIARLAILTARLLPHTAPDK